MKPLRLQSPAKLNLYLKVVNKRPDGFHNIETVFERVDLFDDISLTNNSSGRISIRCNHPHVPTGSKNLVYKVARLLKNQFNISNGVDIVIHKRIPVAAGLAGGSSNAATVLKGLNQLWRLKLSQNQLVDCASKIGSDVAFFLYDSSFALGTGRGEKVKKLAIKTTLYHVIVVPKIKMYTWRVYGALKLPQNSKKFEGKEDNAFSNIYSKFTQTKLLTNKRSDVSILTHHLRKNRILQMSQFMRNDLEVPVFKLCPKLLELKEKLKSLKTIGVMVSGSGPSVYALTESKTDALKIKKVLSRQYTQVFAVKTL